MAHQAIRDLHKDLRENHQVGSDTPERIILPRVSPLMTALQLRLVGISDAGRGFEMTRLAPAYGHVIACFAGHGMVLVNDRWRRCTPGTAYLTPPGVPHAYHTVRGMRWGFAWVAWNAPPAGAPPLIDVTRPVLIRADPEGLRSAIQGLYRESIGPAQLTLVDHWIELVHAYTRRLGRDATRSDPHDLTALWERVDADLAHPWTLSELADLAGVSGEHLRRLCQRHVGRGPMRHVTDLRMRRAAVLLESTRQKVAAVAAAVGYDNAFAFSTAFKRHTGISPVDYRRTRGRDRRPPPDSTHERKGGGVPPEQLR